MWRGTIQCRWIRVSAFSITSASGELTEIDHNGITTGKAIATGNYPYFVAVDPSGQFVYVTNFSDNNVTAYATNGSITGALTELSGSPFGTSGSSPYAIAVDPSGKYAYVANNGNDTVSQFNINPDGTLTLMSVPTVPAGSNPRSITVDPSGKFVYVTNATSGGNVFIYSIHPTTGALSPASVTSKATGVAPYSIVISGAAQ